MAVHVHKYNSNEFWALERVFPHIIFSMFWRPTPNHIHTSHVISVQLRKVNKSDPLTKSSCGFTWCCRWNRNYWARWGWIGSLAHHMDEPGPLNNPAKLGPLNNPANRQHLETLRLKCPRNMHDLVIDVHCQYETHEKGHVPMIQGFQYSVVNV